MMGLIPINLSFFGGGGGGGGFPNTEGGHGNSEINKDKQDKHIEGTKNYNQQIANGKNPSILIEDPQQLLREGAGKGSMVTPTKEAFDFGRIIGKYYHPPTGQYYDSKGNAHIVPAKPNSFPY